MDLGLISNEVLVFESEPNTVSFQEKGKIRDSIVMAKSITGRPDFGPHVEGKETYGNSLRAKIAARLGVSSPRGAQSPTQKKLSRYNAEREDSKSVRSNQRSLTITLQKPHASQQSVRASTSHEISRQSVTSKVLSPQNVKPQFNALDGFLFSPSNANAKKVRK